MKYYFGENVQWALQSTRAITKDRLITFSQNLKNLEVEQDLALIADMFT